MIQITAQIVSLTLCFVILQR